MSLENSGKTHFLGADSPGAKKVCFEDVNEDIFLEVQNETCSQIRCLLGHIA